jgi:predicted dehydrogenase
MTEHQKPLRLGIVGCGAVAERYHLPAIVASPEVRVVAFVDPVLSRAAAAAGRFEGAQGLSSHRDLDGRVDMAVVTAPNAWHAPIAVDLLERGIHLIVEKPMARTIAECDRMCEAAARGGATLAVGHDFRFFPVARAAHDVLASGMLGPIRRVDVRQSAGVRWPCLSEAALLPESGGGVLLSFGIHTLDLLLWWLGDMTPSAYRDDAAGGVEAECDCDMVLSGGARLHLEVSRRRSLRDTTIVECEGGTVEIGIFEPAVLRITLAGGGPTLDARVPDPEFEDSPLRTVFARQLANVVEAVRTRRPPLVGGVDGRRAVELVERCYGRRTPLRRPWDYPEAYQSLTAEART